MTETLTFSLLVGITVGFSAGYLGSIMVLERMALVGDALSHVSLPGLALGLLYNFNPFFGAFAFLFTSAVVIWHLGRVTKLPYETLVGAIFTLALAVGILIVPQPELLEALFGDIANVSSLDLAIAVIVSLTVVLLTRVIFKRIVLSLISEELAVSHGINVARNNLLYLLLVSLVVAIGIKIMGTLLVGFLVVTPAAAARTMSSNLSRYSILSGVFGAISSFVGIISASSLNLPPGPLVVLSGVAIFLIVIAGKLATNSHS
ncbi:metal ABC transporter permease [Candidatus Bathyarchaeota archaeon]|jgi:ABC-type Mn2+/Zn2+ transport system permease subunit|nr:metal ABC transporter permease [Candidatus Bathyarchaeota archaeon]